MECIEHMMASSCSIELRASNTAFATLSRSGLLVWSMSPLCDFFVLSLCGLLKTAIICTCTGCEIVLMWGYLILI